MPFVKGQSGNPGGMSKAVAKTLRLARNHSPQAVLKALELMDTAEEPRDQLKAVEIILKLSGAFRAAEAPHDKAPAALSPADAGLLRDEILSHFRAKSKDKATGSATH